MDRSVTKLLRAHCLRTSAQNSAQRESETDKTTVQLPSISRPQRRASQPATRSMEAAADGSSAYVSKRRREIDSILSSVEQQMMEMASVHAAFTLMKVPWNEWAHGPAAQRFAKLKHAGKSLINRNQRKGWNAWHANRQEKLRRLSLLRSGATSFALRGLRSPPTGGKPWWRRDMRRWQG